MIWSNLSRRKSRSLLTMLGIAVGVASVVALNALVDGFVSGYGAMWKGSGADVLVMQDDALDIVLSAVDEEVGETLAGMPGVDRISEMVYTFAATDGTPYFIVYGYDPDGFAIDHFRIVAGEPLSRRSAGGRPLLLGRAAADNLDKKVGDTFRLYESMYRIVGLYETGEPFEDGAAVILLEDAQQISKKPRQVNAFFIQVREGTDVAVLQERIESRFSTLTTTTSSNFEQEQDMLMYVYGFSWGVSLIALLAGGVGVMNTMLMSVFERTREIGVLRAVGWRPDQVLAMVLGESLALSLGGGLLGLGLGIAAAEGFKQVPLINSTMPPRVSLSLLAQGVGVALGLGLAGGVIPAWRAARLVPAEAMRAESGATTHANRHVRSAVLRDVLRQPVRTLLTVSGISIAMLSIVLLGGMGTGMVGSISTLVGGMDAQLVGMEREGSMDLSRVDEGVVRRVAALPGVRGAEGFLTGYTTMGDLPFFVVFGYQPRGLAIQGLRLVAGTPLTTGRQILLGRVAAENLGRQVGESVRIFDQTFKVVGLYETGSTFQDGGGVISLRDAQSLFGQPRKVSFMGVWLEDPTQADELVREIEARFPEVSISPTSDFAENLTDMQAMEAMVWGISGLALAVGGLGIANTMGMSVFERTREIGVLRALGWRKRHVLSMIVREALALSLLGSMTGMVLGVGLGWLVNRTPFMESYAQFEYTPGLFIQVLGTALLLGLVGGVYPAWRATRLQPVEALRYE